MNSNKHKPNKLNSTLIISIASLAFIASLFFQLTFGASKWKSDITSQMKIYVYLDDSLDVSNIQKMILKFKKLPFLNKIEGKSDIEFKSKNLIANNFFKNTNESYEDLLGENNPFKNLLMIGISKQYKNEKDFKTVAKILTQYEGVHEVTFPNRYISILINKINQITYFMLFIMLCVGIMVYLQIYNSVKLHIHANRIIIKSMQLLGSTNGYIRRPYFINSLLQGLIGSILGMSVSYILIYYFSISITELNNLFLEINVQLIALLTCAIFCCLFSLIATLFSLNAKLKTSISNII
jgi:cell division transport system permease protein